MLTRGGPIRILAAEADGYVISIANNYKKMLTDIVILDTADLSKGPIAIIELPFRLRGGIHGSWVHGEELPDKSDLCDMHCISDEIKAEFGESSLNGTQNST